MASESKDNIKLFNRLTHCCDGSVDCKIFEKLLISFSEYLLLKKSITKVPIEDIQKAEMDECNRLVFIIKFSSKKSSKEFLKIKTVCYKDSTYNVISVKENDIVKVRFEKE